MGLILFFIALAKIMDAFLCAYSHDADGYVRDR